MDSSTTLDTVARLLALRTDLVSWSDSSARRDALARVNDALGRALCAQHDDLCTGIDPCDDCNG